MYYQSVFEALNAKGVKYLVIGGLAIEDLIQLKMIAGREQDLLDIHELETLLENDVKSGGDQA